MKKERDFKFSTGNVVRHILTGAEGTIIAQTRWLNGCHRYGIQPKGLKDGLPLEAITIDEQELVLIDEDGLKPHKVEKKESGGPMGQTPGMARTAR